VKGLGADANIQGLVEYLLQRMQADAWANFWQALGVRADTSPWPTVRIRTRKRLQPDFTFGSQSPSWRRRWP
jgi:hypothetical protein